MLTKGRYGPYIKLGEESIPIRKRKDPIDETEAINIINEYREYKKRKKAK